MTNPTTVVVVDDHALMRGGICSILEHDESVSVIGEANNGREAVAIASKQAPDVMLVDIGMPDLNGMEATRKILAADPKIKIIGLSMHSDARYVTGMLDAGARGYILKTCDSDELLRAIDSVCRGRIYVTSELTHVLMDRSKKRSVGEGHGKGTPPPDSLTPREREILQLIAEGLTSKEIGVRLGVAVKTVETHRTNVIRKLDLHSIAELTKYAIREGMTNLTN